jgi:hypothetical protein
VYIWICLLSGTRNSETGKRLEMKISGLESYCAEYDDSQPIGFVYVLLYVPQILILLACGDLCDICVMGKEIHDVLSDMLDFWPAQE